MEIDDEKDRWHGRFSLALLMSFEECDTLGSLFQEVQNKVEGFGLPGQPRQVPCIASTIIDLHSVPNFFNPAKNRETEVEELRRKYDEDAKSREKNMEDLKPKRPQCY